MTELYIGYKKTNQIVLKEGKVFLNMKELQKIKNNTYNLNQDTRLKLFSENEEHLDEKTLAMLTVTDTKNIPVPTDLIYTISNNLRGYIYPRKEDKEDIRTSKMRKIVDDLTKLKEDAIILGKKGIYIGHLTKYNTENLQVIDPSALKKVHNNSNQIMKNISEINDYYLRTIFNGDKSLEKALIQDYKKAGYLYFGDYLEETAPKYCTVEEYEKNLPKILRIGR